MGDSSPLLDAFELVKLYGSIQAASEKTGIPRSTLSDRYLKAISELGLQDVRSPHITRGSLCSTLARRGEIGGPPIPSIAKPPPGFSVVRNSGAYDAQGNLQRQWVGSKATGVEEHNVPPGFLVKGESALLDAEGRVMQRWVKTREGALGNGLVEALKQEFAEYRGRSPLSMAPSVADEDLMTVYPLPDLHFGAYAWGKETGDNYNVEIAGARALDAASALVAQAPPSRRAVLLGLGDYFHSNDSRAVTPASGNRLDVDGRWHKVFGAGAKLATALVDLLSKKHAEVDVVFIPGNHDPDAAICLTVALGLYYENNDKVSVYDDPGLTWYARHGSVLLGAAHGHMLKPDRMAMMLASDRPEDWGETTHRHFFFGHVHHETRVEVGSVRVESFNTPASRDGWHHASGYRAGQSLSSITFHKLHGEIMRHRVNIVLKQARVRIRAGGL